MSNLDDFLRAARAAPDDLDARLVMADWLEGDADPPRPEWAELTRVQVYAARGQDSRPSYATERWIEKLYWIGPMRLVWAGAVGSRNTPYSWWVSPARTGNDHTRGHSDARGFGPPPKYTGLPWTVVTLRLRGVYLELRGGLVSAAYLPSEAATGANLGRLLAVHPVTTLGLTDRRPAERPTDPQDPRTPGQTRSGWVIGREAPRRHLVHDPYEATIGPAEAAALAGAYGGSTAHLIPAAVFDEIPGRADEAGEAWGDPTPYQWRRDHASPRFALPDAYRFATPDAARKCISAAMLRLAAKSADPEVSQ